jgi:hypothetical protein
MRLSTPLLPRRAALTESMYESAPRSIGERVVSLLKLAVLEYDVASESNDVTLLLRFFGDAPRISSA